ncbi:MAG: hypothetical protein KF802_06710 [Bdellovibrionaceae bacterium]|nr:hypothetical protein [Pseudobdellovibrionaceae bacterium]
MRGNRRGFAMISLLTLLPVLLAAGACLFFIMGFVEDRTATRNGCRRQLLQGLEQAGRPMKQLMDLNPLAWRLRAEKTAALAALAAATAAGNPAAVSAANMRLQVIQQKQTSLDLRQKALLRRADASLKSSQTLAWRAVARAPLNFLVPQPQKPVFIPPALRPDGPGPAPVYVLPPDFERRQTLAQKWQSRFELRGPLQNFLPARGRLNETCAATLVPRGNFWRSRLTEARF